MIDKNNIPEHWEVKKLGEVCDIVLGQSPPSSSYNQKGDGLPFFQGKAEFTELHPMVEKWCNAPNKIALPNDILISVRAPVGATNIANQKCCIGRGLAAIRFENYKYLFYFLNSIEKQLDKKGTGTTFKAVSGEIIKTIAFPFPSKIEQAAIVSKIEELFSELDKGIAQLKTTQQQLKIYRQSLLKAAFEGRLTNKNVKARELSKGWKWMKLKEVTLEKEGLRRGPFGSAIKKEFFVSNGYKVYEQGNAINDDPYRGNYFINKEKYNELINFKIQPFDLIVSCSGVTLGRISELPADAKPGIINQALLRIRLKKELIKNKYFIYHFRSSFFQQKIFAQSQGTAMPNLVGIKDFKEIELFIPSLEEQDIIIQELEHKLTICDKIEETINGTLQQAKSLRQSILKKAFEGKLVEASVEKQEAKVVPLYKPQNEYFYQVQVLGLIAKVSKQNNVQHGEMTLAKYAYLTDKIFGVPTFYDYQRWHLGPYPTDIKKAINNKKFFSKQNNCIELADEDVLLKYNNPYQEQIASAINELATIFSKYNGKERAHKTELLATVCKVIEDIQTTDLQAVRESMAAWPIELKKTLYNTKAEKFSEAETERCLQFLKEKGWDKKLLHQ